MSFVKGQKVKVNYAPASIWNGDGVVTFTHEGTVNVKLETGEYAGNEGGFLIAKNYVSLLEPTSKPESLVGLGGAPTRATTLPTVAAERKQFPIASGFMDYFPDAIAAIANISYRGNQQHHKDKPLHWDRSKSADEADTLMRHFLQRGTLDTDGVAHSAKMAWRALALLQKEIEATTEVAENLPPRSQTGQV